MADAATMTPIVLICTTCPDAATADRIARALVEARLAACVSVGAPVRSTYRWQGAVEHAEEVPLTIKARRVDYAEIEAAIRTWHPYQVPEIAAVPVTAGLPAWLRWVAEETDRDPFGPGSGSTLA